ncbi:myomesin-3 [Cynoglossus semilaevis]|uniref:myomesin-3 n=1 Tax=Cynoglossus semilaevis TaxID=244447 RepID=UPI000D6297A0|nr:myomesin-3-like [Cynoglossus semilaevis]
METRTVIQQEQASQMSHSMQVSSQKKKKTFKSSDEDVSYSDFYPIIPADVLSVKELLNLDNIHSTWDVLRETLATRKQHHRQKWTLFGNEAEKVEIDVIRNQRLLRTRVDKLALRQQAERKASMHIKYLQRLSQKVPDFPIPLRAHTVWEGMTVKLCCVVQGCPPPEVTWYKDGVLLTSSNQPWNFSRRQRFGLNLLEIRWCSPSDGGEYKAVAKSRLGEATTFATVVVNSYQGAAAGAQSWQTPAPQDQGEEALFGSCFPPTWVKEGKVLHLECVFTAPLLPYQQDVSWFRDGEQLLQSDTVDVHTEGDRTALTLNAAHKEHEGVYTVKLKTFDSLLEHSAFVYIQDASAAVVGGPASPLAVQVLDVNRDYVFLTWQPPSADGESPVDGYYVERCDLSQGQWVRCNTQIQKTCQYPVFGLEEGTWYQFRVCAVNKAGTGRPSMGSQPVFTQDPLEHTRTMGNTFDTDMKREMWKCQIRVPLPPTNVHACEVSNTYVVLSWTEPEPRGREPLSFYVERVSLYIFFLYLVLPDVPSPPSAIALLLCTGSEMVLGWRAPQSRGGAPILGYYLDQREDEQVTWREVNVKSVKERQFKVCSLSSGHWYRFRVFAANMAGVGKPSEASDAFLCEKWTMPEPGCPFDLQVKEVRNDSLVLLWKTPLYEGQSAICGYILEMCQDDESEEWRTVNDQDVSDTRYKVSGLQAGQTYRFRVSAVNKAGVGRASLPTEPVTAETKPGTKDIEIGVDDDGFIFLGYEADKVIEQDDVVWNKNYTEPIDPERAQSETTKNKSVLTFTEASEDDLGLYTIEAGDNSDLSSSYDFTAEDLERLKELSWQVRNPLIALKSGWNVEVSDKGDVRLWLQTESLSKDAELCLILNDKEISSTTVRASYFSETVALANAKRHDYKRKSGPYFKEYLSWSINEDFELVIKCQVTNTNKDSCLSWFKDDRKLTQVVYDGSTGVSTLTLSQISKDVSGSYRAVVTDKRGEDVSTLQLLGGEYDKLLQQLSRQCALSAGPLNVDSTAEGFRLYCSLKNNLGQIKTSWYFREKKIDQEVRRNAESSAEMVWINIFNPTDNDKGKYTLEMFDGLETHRRHLDLSGQVFADALLQHQTLKQSAIAEKNRAKVSRGLPDVVAIREGKSLCLTCFIEGEPAPQISWLRNDKEVVDPVQFTITKEAKRSTITINNVSLQDSGKYSIFVRNTYGCETASVTVSVYRHGEKPPANAVEMGF